MKKFVPLLLIVVALVAAYAPSLRNGFVWDDEALVLRDPLIRSWRLIPEGFQHFLFIDATASDFYRPIQRLTYTLEYQAFGFWPAAYHAGSIVFHVAAAVALFAFASELLRLFPIAERTRRWIVFAAVIAWGLHPVHTSAVAYVAGRADSLAALFGFAALYFGLRSLRAGGRVMWTFVLGSFVAFLFSALSKESGLIFLALWVVLLVLQRRWKNLVSVAVVAAFVGVIYCSLRLPAEHIPAPASANPPPLLVRPIIVARAAAEYTGLILLPWNLHMDRDVETRPEGLNNQAATLVAWRELQTLAGLLCIAAFVYWMMRARRADRAVFTSLVLAGVTYLPISGVVPLNATVAEHWLYVPLAFLLLAVATAVARYVEIADPARARRFFPVIATGAAIWILFLGVRTFLRTFDWHDQRAFVERTIATGGDSARMRINLAGLQIGGGELEEAKGNLQLALQKEPAQPFAIINLAAVAVKQRDFAAAHELLARAKEMPLVQPQAFELLAVLANKETGEADPMRLRLAARSGPPNWQIEKRYVQLLAEIGAVESAIGELRDCLKTQWYRADTWQLLAQLQRKAGRPEEAAEADAMAHRFDVHLSETRAAL